MEHICEQHMASGVFLKAEMMRGIELMLQLQGELGCRIPVGMLDRVQFQNTYFFLLPKTNFGNYN